MSYLLYCIFGSSPHQTTGIPPGVEGQHVFVVAQNGLRAALSELGESGSVPDVSAVLAYEKVVEAFHRHLTVIPMRYGCRFEDSSQAASLLESRREEYEAVLHQIEGMTEMGVHVLLEKSNKQGKRSPEAAPAGSFPPFSSSGTGYLAARRQHYLTLDRAALDHRCLVEELCDSLSGLYARSNAKLPSSKDANLLSVYFLMPRGSVEGFRRAARRRCSTEGIKLLVSGPWPPYNFVEFKDSLPLYPPSRAME